MNPEHISNGQPFRVFPRFQIISKEQALKELSSPCSKFQSPYSLEERLRLFLQKSVQMSDPLQSVTYCVTPGAPLNWQALLRYLHHHSIIMRPEFDFIVCRNDLPKTYNISLDASWDTETSSGVEVYRYGHASDISLETAMSKAVGELLERYFLTCYKKDSLLYATSFDLSRKGVPVFDVTELNTFLPFQRESNPRFSVDSEKEYAWILGETLEGENIYIPAQLVFWNYDVYSNTNEPILTEPNTNGAGGYFTKEAAILSGLLELIQRDAFLIYWLNRISPPIIDVSTITDPDICRLLESVSRYGLDIYFLNVTSDINIPTVVCVVVDTRQDDPIVIMGGSSGFTIRDTILHSMTEALSVAHFVVQREKYTLQEPYIPFVDRNISRSQRLDIWHGKEMFERFRFFLEGIKQTPEDFIKSTLGLESLDEKMKYVKDELAKKGSGYEVYLYEAHDPVLKALGYHVVRTIVPQLVSLYLNEHMITLGARRLREVPARLGYSPAKDFFPWPHPFP